MKRQPSVVLTVTPGRSGSVFLADVLQRSFGERARVTHERLGPQHTLPRVFFHAFSEPRLSELAAFPPVARFLDEVRSELAAGTPVIEVGMFSSHLIPLVAREFPGQLRVLFLFRHPAITAASHSVRGMYHPWPHWTFYSLGHLTPFDRGMTANGFRARWRSMSPFERNLYAWVEYAELRGRIAAEFADVPQLEIRSEDLFARPAEWCGRAAEFAGLDGDITLDGTRKNEIADRSPRRFGLEPGWREALQRHHEVRALAESMGYRLDDPRVLESMRKYEAPRNGAGRVLRQLGWFSARSYARRLTRPRFWRQYARWRRLRRAHPEYFKMMEDAAQSAASSS